MKILIMGYETGPQPQISSPLTKVPVGQKISICLQVVNKPQNENNPQNVPFTTPNVKTLWDKIVEDRDGRIYGVGVHNTVTPQTFKTKHEANLVR
jgi:hypothetical protein